jgi:hypothetical protein
MKMHNQMLIQVKSRKYCPVRPFRLFRKAHTENQTARIRILTPGPRSTSSATLRAIKLHSAKYTKTKISMIQETTINRAGADNGLLALLPEMAYRIKVCRLTREIHPINNPARSPKTVNM